MGHRRRTLGAARSTLASLTYDAGMAARLRWLIDFCIDYGSIALIAALAVLYLSARSGIAAAFGGLLALLAIKLWRDVQEDRRAERRAREVG